MKFKEKLYRFMYGRYGVDSLYNFCNVAIIVLLIMCLFGSLFIRNEYARAIVTLIVLIAEVSLIVWNTFRMFSRNVAKRRKENERFLAARGACKRFFTRNTSRKTKSNNHDNSMYIFRDCTYCGVTLRLPVKGGRHLVTCPKCSGKFYVKGAKIKKKKK